MDGPSYPRSTRGRGHLNHDPRGRPHSRNKHWSANDGGSRSHTPNHSDGERWERGGHRGGGRGRGSSRGAPQIFHNVTLRLNHSPSRPAQPQRAPVARQHIPEPTNDDVEIEDVQDEDDELYDEDEEQEEEAAEEVQQTLESQGFPEIHEPELETAEERERFYQELVKAREQERKTAIAEGKMDDPLVPKRLEDAISIVGTCMDMCPRFERYRRERENNLFEWETIPGTKRVDHNRAVKMYERAAGDKTLPSDLRPPLVLKRTLNYLFRDLLPRGGFVATFNFIRDRSRSVRNDFTMQHITGDLAIECHDRCARFHILALHYMRKVTGFSIPLEEQQLMNTLQSLKEFYEDQRGRYESPTELEMRVYHRLIHIRDQKERHEDIPDNITSHPVFKLTTAFRLHVQEKSAPISKTSNLVVTAEGMQIFGQLATVLKEQGSTVMVYLVACLLERLFGEDTIDDIEAIKGDLSISDIIDGESSHGHVEEIQQNHATVGANGVEGEEEQDGDEYYEEGDEDYGDEGGYEPSPEQGSIPQAAAPAPFKPSATEWPSNAPNLQPSTSSSTPASAFAGLVAKPNPFGVQSVFGASPFAPSATTSTPMFGAFGAQAPASTPSIFNTQQQTNPVSSPFSSTNGSSSAPEKANVPPPNFFSQPAMPLMPTSQPPPSDSRTSIFNGSSSIFSNSFASTSTVASTTSLNPKAPEFTLPQKSSIFSQPLTFSPSNGTSSGSTPQPTPRASTIASEPTLIINADSNINGDFTAKAASSSPSSTPAFFNKPSPPGSKSVTPPLNRPVAPPLLKIDTNTTNSTSGSSSPGAVPSPRIPPPMAKMQPISLPSTPTMVLQPPSAFLGHLRSTLGASGGSGYFSSQSSTSSQEMLSPLVMGSPTATTKPFHNFTPLSTPNAAKRFRVDVPPSPAVSPTKGKSPERSAEDTVDTQDRKKKALEFEQKSFLVRHAFQRWVSRATDRAAYLEARKRADEYREKLQRSRAHDHPGPLGRSRGLNGNGSVLDKKRRVSTNGTTGDDHGQYPLKKRARKRPSYQPPRTDEELAKRFKENHEEHELRWAKGSFIQAIRKSVGAANPAVLKKPWNIWLSTNPESDATAIWLERKFDVPASGSWVSETVFSIPLSSAGGPGSVGYPGLIVFESTPLGDISDDLERKYRILDDCSRLREIVKSLSPRRHFIPSLLVVCWDEEGQNAGTSDFSTMVQKLVADSVIQSSQVYAITASTKDLDNKLDGVLKTLSLDTEGKLVRTLPLQGVFKIFSPTFDAFLVEWMENCTVNGRFNWNLYAQVVQASITLLNTMSALVQSLLELAGPQDPLPKFDHRDVGDSESCYDITNEWLSTLSSRDDARMVATDMQSHRNIGQDFPGRIFIDHLFELTKTRFERLYTRSANTERAILITSINTSLEGFKDAISPLQLKLSQAYNFCVRRSPKRRADSTMTSEMGSPEMKRPRFAASTASTDVGDADSSFTVPTTPRMNGNREVQTPSPTGSTASTSATDRTQEAPTVTVAMLRALTRDLKKKYAVGCS